MFTEHPNSVGESYGEHFIAATSFARGLFKGTICCLIHAVLPFLFKQTASDEIRSLHLRMVENREGEKARRKKAQAVKEAA